MSRHRYGRFFLSKSSLKVRWIIALCQAILQIDCILRGRCGTLRVGTGIEALDWRLAGHVRDRAELAGLLVEHLVREEAPRPGQVILDPILHKTCAHLLIESAHLSAFCG